MNQTIHILYIEDDEDDFFISQEYLSEIENLDCEIEWVKNCEDGCDKLTNSTYDICLLDYRLGACNGIELLHAVNAFNLRTPIIFLTGQGDREIDVKAMEAGASDYLLKDDLNPYILEKTIRHAIERKKYESLLLEIQDELTEALNEIRDNQKELIEMENLRSVKELAGAVAHEFSQPLQALSNYYSIIKNGGDVNRFIDKSGEMIKRIAGLTENLRNITSLQKKDYVDTQILDIKSASKIKKDSNSVLILDDESVILETLVEMFEMRGFTCDGVTSGHEALDLVKKNDYDMIISDISMPIMSGPEFFKQTKAIGNNSTFIFLTGYEITDNEKGIIEQADGLLSKPISFDQFFEALEEYA